MKPTALALVVLLALPASAGLRKLCKQQCTEAIVACDLSPDIRGALGITKVSACKRAVRRSCRQNGLFFACPATTTTTTSSSTSSTTTLPMFTITTTTSTTSVTTGPRTLELSVLAWGKYLNHDSASCPYYEGVLVNFTTSNLETGLATDGPLHWQLLPGCSGGPVTPPEAIREAFALFLLPDFGFVPPCSASLVIPPTGTGRCVVFFDRSFGFPDRLTYVGGRCFVTVRFGCLNPNDPTSCLPLPANVTGLCE